MNKVPWAIALFKKSHKSGGLEQPLGPLAVMYEMGCTTCICVQEGLPAGTWFQGEPPDPRRSWNGGLCVPCSQRLYSWTVCWIAVCFLETPLVSWAGGPPASPSDGCRRGTALWTNVLHCWACGPGCVGLDAECVSPFTGIEDRRHLCSSWPLCPRACQEEVFFLHLLNHTWACPSPGPGCSFRPPCLPGQSLSWWSSGRQVGAVMPVGWTACGSCCVCTWKPR